LILILNFPSLWLFNSESFFYNFCKTTPDFSVSTKAKTGPVLHRSKVYSLIVPPELPIIQTTPAPELVPAAGDALRASPTAGTADDRRQSHSEREEK